MSEDALTRLIRSMPKPKADAFHIHSEQEREALRMDFYSQAVDYFCGGLSYGVPLHITDDTPPGVLRAMLRGEVVEDVPIRCRVGLECRRCWTLLDHHCQETT